jgi:hypothetical protein
LEEDCRWHQSVGDELARGLVQTSGKNRALMEGWVRAARMPLREALAALEPLWDEKSEPYGAVLEALDAQAEKRWHALGLDVGALP